MFEVILFSLLGGVISLLGAILLFRNEKSATGLAKYGTPFAAGVLLATAFTDLLPEALENDATIRSVMLAALLGMLVFFMLERYLRWFHHHHEGEDTKHQSPSSLIIIGDTLHNALDGIAIGAAFLIDVPTGIVTTAAVAAHEIPQEIGDFGLLLHNGMRRRKVLLVNVISAMATTLSAAIIFALGDTESLPVPLLLAATAGFFIYIAASDIIPEIHEKLEPGTRDLRPWLLLIGALFIIFGSPIAHDYIDAGHVDSSESHSLEHAGEDEHDADHKNGDEEDHHDDSDHEDDEHNVSE